MVRRELIDRKGFSATFVLACGVAALSTYVVARVLAEDSLLPAIIGHSWCVAAYLIGLISCWHATALYPKQSPIRLGWLAFSANCVFSMFRHIALNPLFAPVAGSSERVYLFSQMFQLPALACALAGLIAIWWGVYRLGLGFRVRWFDWAGVITAAVVITWGFRNHLSHARSGNEVIVVLQAVSLCLLLSIGGVGLLLQGLAMQMGGGRLAVVIRCVAAYALTRSFLTLSQGNRESYSLVWWSFFFAVPWIFAFGAAYFCWMADDVRRSIARERMLAYPK